MRIQSRAFLTILLSSTLLVVAMVWLMQWSIDRGLIEYVNARQRAEFTPLATEFERLYGVDQWRQIRGNPDLFAEIVIDNAPNDDADGRPARQPPPPPRERPPGREGDARPERRRPPPPPRRGPRGPPPVTLLDANRSIVGGPGQNFDQATKIALSAGDEQIGWLLLPRTDQLTRDFDVQFQSQQRETFLIIGGVVVGLAALCAFLFAPSITRPIRQLAGAANRLARKDYDLPEMSERSDEIGQLSRDMHDLARTLKQNEEVRQRWFADTSHELRTPVSIIRGEIEAMLDGVRELSHDNLHSLKQEVLQLQKLIEDLSDLSNADIGSLRYQKEVVDLNELLASNVGHYQQLCKEHGLRFRFDDAGGAVEVFGDEARLQQLVGNVVYNSCKYTDSPGEVVLSLSRATHEAVLVVEDTAPGVPASSLPWLFDYLYRVESSRNRRTGGAGLGLAIAQRIVEAHEGRIEAMDSSLGGLRVVIRLVREL